MDDAAPRMSKIIVDLPSTLFLSGREAMPRFSGCLEAPSYVRLRTDFFRSSAFPMTYSALGHTMLNAHIMFKESKIRKSCAGDSRFVNRVRHSNQTQRPSGGPVMKKGGHPGESSALANEPSLVIAFINESEFDIIKSCSDIYCIPIHGTGISSQLELYRRIPAPHH
jgi:hypothetical protein